MFCFWQQLLYSAALNSTSESSRTRTVLQSSRLVQLRSGQHDTTFEKGVSLFVAQRRRFDWRNVQDLLEEMHGFRCWLKNEYVYEDFTSVISSGETTPNCRMTINKKLARCFKRKTCMVTFAGVYKGVFIAVKLCWLECVMQIYFSSVLNWSLRKQSKLYPF